MALATLSIDLEARLAKLQSGLDKAARLAEKDAARMERAFGQVKAVAGGIGGALVAGLSVTAITQFIGRTVDGVDALNDFADATGTSVENASALEDVALRTGASMDTVQAAVLRLNKQLSDAKPGGSTEQALKAIGLSATELQKLDPADALLQVAKALTQYEDGADKARLMQELFGKSTKEVAAYLKDLGEQGKLVATVTKQQADEAEAFNKQLFALQATVVGVARDLSGPLVKSLLGVAEAVKAARGNFGGFVDFALTAGKEALKGNTFRDAADGAAYYAGKLRELRAAGASEEDIKNTERLLAYYKQIATATAPDLGQTDPRELARRGRGPATKSLSYVGTTDEPKTPKSKTAKAEEQLFVGPEVPESLKAALKAIEATDTAKIAALNDQLDRLLALQRAGDTRPELAEAIADTRKELADLDPAAKAAAESAKRLQAILDQTPSGSMKSVLSDIELINKAFADGALDAERWAEAIRVATGRLQEGGSAAEKTDDVARDLGMTFSSAFEDAIVGGAKLSDTLKALEEDIMRIVTRKLITEPLAGGLTEFLGGLMGGKAGAAGMSSLFSQGASWLSSAVGSLFGGFFADGGTLQPGKWGIVGERGPELIYGGTTGRTIVPNAGGNSRPVNVHTTYIVQGALSRETQTQTAAKTGRAVSRAMARNN